MKNNIKKYRFLKGQMTQQQLADRVSVSRQTIIAIEKGTFNPSVRLALKIARALGTTVEALFSLEQDD